MQRISTTLSMLGSPVEQSIFLKNAKRHPVSMSRKNSKYLTLEQSGDQSINRLLDDYSDLSELMFVGCLFSDRLYYFNGKIRECRHIRLFI